MLRGVTVGMTVVAGVGWQLIAVAETVYWMVSECRFRESPISGEGSHTAVMVDIGAFQAEQKGEATLSFLCKSLRMSSTSHSSATAAPTKPARRRGVESLMAGQDADRLHRGGPYNDARV